MAQHISDIEMSFLGFDDSSRQAYEDFEKVFPFVETKTKPLLGAPTLSLSDTPPRDRVSSFKKTSKPIDARALGELFVNNPVIPAPPGAAVVGGAAQTAQVNTPNFKVNPNLLGLLTNLLQRR